MIDKDKIIKISQNEGIVRYSSDLISKYNFPSYLNEILKCLGVPKNASPYIKFFSEKEGGGSKLNEYYNLSLYEDSEYVTKDILERLKIKFNDYVVLGSVESNVFVLNKKYEVIEVDYETLDEHFINDTLNNFLESSLIYQTMIFDIRSRYEHEKVIDFMEYITQDDIELLKRDLIKIDKKSLQDNSFWAYQIELLEEGI